MRKCVVCEREIKDDSDWIEITQREGKFDVYGRVIFRLCNRCFLFNLFRYIFLCEEEGSE